MVNVASLVSLMVAVSVLLTRTRTLSDGASGTVQVYVPVFATESVMTVASAKPLVEYSSFTFPVRLAEDHVICSCSPTSQVSPPLSERKTVPVLASFTSLVVAAA